MTRVKVKIMKEMGRQVGWEIGSAMALEYALAMSETDRVKARAEILKAIELRKEELRAAGLSRRLASEWRWAAPEAIAEVVPGFDEI
ncbi:hypothetical protein [Microvirga sp. P5_D2]|jgi:hypothetical protein